MGSTSATVTAAGKPCGLFEKLFIMTFTQQYSTEAEAWCTDSELLVKKVEGRKKSDFSIFNAWRNKF